jgi:uncharacterized protein
VHHILFYDYVEDVLERRGPYREEHLVRIRSGRDAGRIVMAGAVGDPPHGAVIVFGPDVDPDEVEEFAASDPYVTGGIVTGRRVVPWNVV